MAWPWENQSWSSLGNSSIGQAAKSIGVNLDPTLGSGNTGAGTPWGAENRNKDLIQQNVWSPFVAEVGSQALTGGMLPGAGAASQLSFLGSSLPFMADYSGQDRANKAKQDQDKIRTEQDAARAAEDKRRAEEQKRQEQAAWQTQKTNEANTQADLEKSWRSAFSKTGRRMYA